MLSNFTRINGTKKVKKRKFGVALLSIFIERRHLRLNKYISSRIFRVSVIVYWSEEEEEREREREQQTHFHAHGFDYWVNFYFVLIIFLFWWGILLRKKTLKPRNRALFSKVLVLYFLNSASYAIFFFRKCGRKACKEKLRSIQRLVP